MPELDDGEILWRVCWRSTEANHDKPVANDFLRRLSKSRPKQESGISLFSAKLGFQPLLKEKVKNRSHTARFVAGCTVKELRALGVNLFINEDQHVSVRCTNCDTKTKAVRCHPVGQGETECPLIKVDEINAAIAARFSCVLDTAKTHEIDLT